MGKKISNSGKMEWHSCRKAPLSFSFVFYMMKLCVVGKEESSSRCREAAVAAAAALEIVSFHNWN